jgi:cytochrome c oxidase subunit 2
MLIFWICVAIGVLVFGVMFASVYLHRKSRGVQAAQFHHSTLAEIVWTIIPFVILVGMAIPAAGTLIKMEDMRGTDMTIKVTGYQWKWQYTYLDEGVDFFSTLHPDSNRARQTGTIGWGRAGYDQASAVGNYLLEVDRPMVVPVGKKVRLLVTSNDVIHAWWVPDLGIKKDAIPGYINEMWFKVEADKPGIYRGQCAELCGRDHGFMPVVVKAVSEDEYKAWVTEQKGGAVAKPSTQEPATDVAAIVPAAPAPGALHATAAPAADPQSLTKEQLMTKGKEVYDMYCAACHKQDGSGMPPTFPAITGSKLANGDVKEHILRTLKGKNAMPPFGGQLNDEQIAAVITYERNALGNSTGDIVQPSQVRVVR